MLCISIAPESRRLGRVDLYNAASQADLVEFRLDRLGKTPDIAELLEGATKPVLFSCRRRSDGGLWNESEDERLQLLRSAIVAGPAYVELELDVAAKIPRFGKTKRVVSFTSLTEPLGQIESLYEQAIKAQADVVKLVGPTTTLDIAWPLLAAVSKRRDIPLVGMGLGRQGLTFTLLGLKHGSPWIYAALEKGLEAFPGQATVAELDDIYRWRQIGPQTRFVAVAGFEPTDVATVKVLNAGFAANQLNVRCLPLEIGTSDKFPKRLETLQVDVVAANSQSSERALELSQVPEDAARISRSADLLVKQSDGWHGLNTLWRAALRSIEASLGATAPEDRPLDRRNVLIVGAGGLARGVAYGIQRRKGLISITGSNNDEAQAAAESCGARHVPIMNMYDTLCDVIVFAEEPPPAGGKPNVKINPSFLRPHMTVIDLTDLPRETQMLREARERGCKVVEPMDVLYERLAVVFKTIAGKDLSREVMHAALGDSLAE